MLGKLFKHEFKTSAKLLIPLNLIVIQIAVVREIGDQFFESDCDRNHINRMSFVSERSFTDFTRRILKRSLLVSLYYKPVCAFYPDRRLFDHAVL